MSLDVYLTLPGGKQRLEARIFVREDGSTKKLTRAEWAFHFPGQEPYSFEEEINNEVYTDNITHNLAKMATAAGLYDACWRPEEAGITKAAQLIPLLQAGLAKLKAEPAKYQQYDAPNGWGTYKQFVPWVERYLAACRDNPEADVSVSR